MKGLWRQLYEFAIPFEKRLRFYKFRHPDDFTELRHKIYPSAKGDFSLRAYDLHKTIFVHITKTAGTSVAKSLFTYLPYHYTAIEYRVIYGQKIFNDYFKFAFVRNPWDRLYSAFRYLKSGGWNETDQLWGKRHLSAYNDFNHFVADWLTKSNIKKHMHFKPQHEFVCDSKGNILLDYLAYFESLEDDYAKIAERLAITTPLGKHNINPGNDYRVAYSEKAKKIVAEVYKKDIELFGYDFGGITNRQYLKNASL